MNELNELIICMVELSWFSRVVFVKWAEFTMSTSGISDEAPIDSPSVVCLFQSDIRNDRRPAAVSQSTKSFWITGRRLIQNLQILGGSFCTLAELSRSVFSLFFPFATVNGNLLVVIIWASYWGNGG